MGLTGQAVVRLAFEAMVIVRIIMAFTSDHPNEEVIAAKLAYLEPFQSSLAMPSSQVPMALFVAVNAESSVVTPRTLVVKSTSWIKELVSASSVVDALGSIDYLAAIFKQDFLMATYSFIQVAIN